MVLGLILHEMTKILFILLRKVTLERLVNSGAKSATSQLLLLGSCVLFLLRFDTILVLAATHFASMLQIHLSISLGGRCVDI